MSTYNIQITEPAEEDLYAIGSYISKELLEPETAKSIIAKIAKVINSLEDMPLRNALVIDNHRPHTRYFSDGLGRSCYLTSLQHNSHLKINS